MSPRAESDIREARQMVDAARKMRAEAVQQRAAAMKTLRDARKIRGSIEKQKTRDFRLGFSLRSDLLS